MSKMRVLSWKGDQNALRKNMSNHLPGYFKDEQTYSKRRADQGKNLEGNRGGSL